LFTDLQGAEIEASVFSNRTIISFANFKNAFFRDCDLSMLVIESEQIRSCFGDASVKLPKGINLPEHWPRWVLPSSGEHDFRNQWRKWQADPENYTPPPKPD